VDFVQFLTCEEQVGDYLRAFKTAFWPNGQLFDSVQERSKAVQMRTRVVAKAKLIAALPGQCRVEFNFVSNSFLTVMQMNFVCSSAMRLRAKELFWSSRPSKIHT